MIGRCAGVLIPLFSVRTEDDFGRGEITGLVPLAKLVSRLGHRLIQLLPIEETAPGETSPYSALSVFAIDPVYVSVTNLPGVRKAVVTTARAGLVTSSSVHDRLLAIRSAKLQLLRASYESFSADSGSRLRSAFATFVDSNREWLGDYALYRALKERLKWITWRRWPMPLRRRDKSAIDRARRELAKQIEMYSYWQFVAYRQWAGMRRQLARMGVMLGGDLAFLPAIDSAEVWAHQELFDLRRTVGAPPDAFSADGQRWGLPMPRWDRIRASDYGFIRARVRRARQLYDLLRIDHVVGLFRTYSFGRKLDGAGRFDPAAEANQREQGEEILHIVKAESAPMEIVAEDLGVIPPFVRESLNSLGVAGYKVARWEKHDWNLPSERYVMPSEYPELSLAATGTHDTETLAVWWSEISANERRSFLEAFGVNSHQEANGTLDESMLDQVLGAIYASPSRYVVTPIQDLFGWSDRINTPGTIDAGNWTWRLPFTLERLCNDPKISARLDTLHAIAVNSHRFPADAARDIALRPDYE